MYESVMWIVAGLVVGWLAGTSMKGGGYGRVGDIAVAAVGALAGVWLITLVLPEPDRGGVLGSVIAGAVAAALFVASARLLTRPTARTVVDQKSTSAPSKASAL